MFRPIKNKERILYISLLLILIDQNAINKFETINFYCLKKLISFTFQN